MREIKFRALTTYGNEFVYGDLNQKPIHYDCQIIENGVVHHSVKRSSIGQFTGLKDKNGIDIYEDDVIHLGDSNIKYQVTFKNGYFGGKQIGNESMIGLFFWLKNIEIIGNIYQNPELLK